MLNIIFNFNFSKFFLNYSCFKILIHYEEILKIMKGEVLAASITTALDTGGEKLATQIKAAFEKVIPPKIVMEGELGVIKVHLTGGDILQKFNGGILEEMEKKIHTAILETVKPDAIKPIKGQGAGNT